MLLSKVVEVPILNNRKYYEERGYDIPLDKRRRVKRGTIIKVKIEDVKTGSHVDVKFLCDYCLEKGIQTELSTPYKDYLNRRKKLSKDCCNECRSLKIIESNQKYYGVNSTTQIKEIREQQLKTLKNNYGVDNPLKSDEIKKKVVETNIEKYGTEYGLQNEEVKQKKIQTNLEKYGCINPMQTDEVKLKQQETLMKTYGVRFASQIESSKIKYRETCLKRYGVTSVMKIKEVARRAKINGNLTMYNNQTMTSSRQQKYINNLLNGKLNYPVDTYSLDIAFPEGKIYIEYDGSGHDLSVRCNSISRKMFTYNQMKRYYYLKDRGWKMIRFISHKDYLPLDEVIVEIIDKAIEYINTGHSWFKIYIDEEKIECREYAIKYNFGQLRKIQKEDLEDLITA